MSIPVITLGAVASAFVPGLEQLRGPVTVVRRCEELPELVAACQSGLALAAIFAPGAADLTASLVERLRFAGVAVVALTEGALLPDPVEGIAYVGATVEPAALAAAVARAVEDLGDGPDGSDRPRRSLAYADPLHLPEAAAPPPVAADDPGDHGLRNVFELYESSRWKRFRYLQLPSALPDQCTTIFSFVSTRCCMTLLARNSPRRCTRCTERHMRVRNSASSIAVSPPPITATSWPR